MAVLITGGSGGTATRLATFLQRSNTPIILTSRSGKNNLTGALQKEYVAKFDFTEKATYHHAFEHAESRNLPISIVYLVTLGEMDPQAVKDFIDYARQEHQVNRFLLLGGHGLTMDFPIPLAKIWKYLHEIGVDYAMLAPSWFNTNLTWDEYRLPIKQQSKIFSATGDNKIPWTSSDDIAEVGAALINRNQPFGGWVESILGPELLTYDEVAAILTKELGREIQHIKLSPEDREKNLLEFGISTGRARFVVHLETLTGRIASGFPSSTVKDVTGHEARTFSEYVREIRNDLK